MKSVCVSLLLICCARFVKKEFIFYQDDKSLNHGLLLALVITVGCNVQGGIDRIDTYTICIDSPSPT